MSWSMARSDGIRHCALAMTSASPSYRVKL
jgi:hypothetical protein